MVQSISNMTGLIPQTHLYDLQLHSTMIDLALTPLIVDESLMPEIWFQAYDKQALTSGGIQLGYDV